MRTYARFGVLPDGKSFGAARTPTQENSYARDVVIVAEDGEIRACGRPFPDGGIGDHYPEPEVSGFLVEGDVTIEGWELCNVPVRELRFAPEVECIGEGEFAMLEELKRVAIPAGVRMVESCAFQWCDKLADLVIEGDLSRVAGWHAEAFKECPCEAEYLELRRKAEAGEL